MLRQLAGTKRGVGRAGDRVAPRRRNHIVNGGNGTVENRHRRAVNRVIMHHRVSVRAGLIGRQMKTPLAGRQFALLMLTFGINIHNVRLRQLLVRNTRRRDQHSPLITHAHVAGGPLI